MRFKIETLGRYGWTNDTLGPVERRTTYATREKAQASIEEMRGSGPDWRDAEYRVVEVAEQFVVLVDDMEKLPEGRMYAATIYKWDGDPTLVDDEAIFADFMTKRDDYHVERTRQFSTPSLALNAGLVLARKRHATVIHAATLY